jgi:hypothetical protein
VDSLVIKGANCDSQLGSVTDITCAGQTGTATLTVLSATGAPLAGRQIRFEALQGQYSFVLDDAASQLSKSITVTTDSQGQAIVRFRVDNNALTSFGLIRATDLASGARLDRGFPIAQTTDGSAVLSVTPKSWKIVGTFKGQCSSAAEVGYYVFGGLPPYRVVSSIPSSIAVGNQFGGTFGATTSVAQNGGYFAARTLGGCILNSEPIIFITDASGRTVGVGLENTEGQTELPTEPPAPGLVTSPETLNVPFSGGSTCNLAGAPGAPAIAPLVFTVRGGTGTIQASVSNPSAITLGQGTAATAFTGVYQIVGTSVAVNIAPGVYSPGPIGTITLSDALATLKTVTIRCPASASTP